MKRELVLMLVHYPVLDRQGEVVTTAITNLDLHDIARSAYTYDAKAFFVVHPIEAQRRLAERVKSHWVEGSGARRIPDRKPPMTKLHVMESVEQALAELEPPVELWATSASASHATLGYSAARDLLNEGEGKVVLLFGTGWGLAPALFSKAHRVLQPILSQRSDGYNHLSVRAAAAITLDRLLAGESR
jgi:hypothetical protein